MLAPRTPNPRFAYHQLCPDLALITTATGKLLLAVEIVRRGDHHADTVIKKEIYEKIRVPRLWMVDPRYDNVEVYHSTEFGLAFKGILAGSEVIVGKIDPGVPSYHHRPFCSSLRPKALWFGFGPSWFQNPQIL